MAPVPIPAPWRPPEPAEAAFWLRGGRWVRAMARLARRIGRDRARGVESLATNAVYLREAFEEVGGTALKLGQQLSIRVDLFPWEVCDELARLTDRVPPFPFERAVEAVEAAIGGPLDTVFADFERVPIGSASIACVYRARLHDGRRVAVKVCRPDVAEQFACDLRAFETATRLAEAITAVRPGFFAPMREALRAMFTEELDLRTEARYQALYARYAREAGLDWLTCPGAFRQWCTERVLVSEFVHGVSCATVLAAVEKRDPDALAAVARADIDPELVAKRLYYVSLWGRLEAPLFHGDPHPANLIVLPGSRLCFIDFGACGVTSRPRAALQMQVVRHLTQQEVSGAARTAFSQLSPLPPVDAEALRRELESQFWKFMHGLEDPEAAWFDRTSAALWMSMMEATRRFELPVNLDMLKIVRSTLLYDTLANRLGTAITQEETVAYLRDQAAREARRAERRRRPREGEAGGMLRTLAEARATLDRAARHLRAIPAYVPRLRAGVSARATAARAVLVAGLVAVAIAGAMRATGRTPAMGDPAVILAGICVACALGQRLRFGLGEVGGPARR